MSTPERLTRLSVFLTGEHIGSLERRGPDRYRLQYLPQTLERHSPGSILLSASLPVRQAVFTPSETRPFFEGLLPEGAIRETIARNLRISVDNGFGLLHALGAECAGAVMILPDTQNPMPPEASGMRWLDENTLAELIHELPEHPLGVSDGERVRHSLGGVQEKLLITRTPAGKYGQPLEGGPSTHIVKPGHDRYPGIVANEAFCLRVARSVGLPVASAEMIEVGGRDCLVVERFDRGYDEQARVVRLHQEDICQALGRLPSAKYETEGGPSLAETFALLRELAGPHTARDVNNLVLATVLNWLMGNSDAHGKNIGLIYEEPGEVRLAPFYDIVSTVVYDLKPEMAMLIGGIEDPEQVDTSAWLRMSAECGLGRQIPRQVENIMGKVLKCAQVTRDLALAEGWHQPVIDDILDLATRRVTQSDISGRST